MEHLNSSILPELWQNLSTSVILLDEDFKIHYANNSASELLGLGQKRLIEQPFESIFHHHLIDLKRLKRYVLEDGIDCQQHKVDVVFIDNRASTINLFARKLHINNRDFIQLECRRIDEELRFDKAFNQDHQYQAARNLIRGLAHEIKNPLGGIRGAAQLLQYEVEQQERDECAQLIIAQADRLRELVDRLLGPNELPKRTLCNIHKVLESILKLSALETEHALTLRKDYDPSIPDICVDESKIQQVVLNIVRNAQQALQGKGEICVTTRICHRVRRGKLILRKALLIKIADNGPGIDEALKATLFYPMVTNKEGGSGLGLSIAQTLVEQHNGFIECDSWSGHTEFCIYLPFENELGSK
ncbi:MULTISPECIES: nitrogen regulation protein NR(II) [Pseudoalteromonas]|uniref:Sensory histidine kinase/phosphatase NtrB n=1 Tax=Pseudoalteromonas obscura TaxID=3048491 RepID=A0ABT7EQD6_9GAMM|nr:MULTISPECIES: nitrogen regulation protein NR(II) [Pseudoalteromonas]MBQ4839352.1 nitrogen regulation protein NR(II) [Pseudoalteromonas luteoviolacea]MDK2597208.1 nitrogen regulation protein NR(II) [Pseudoalteromonas sp. P94(2023)]